MSNWHDKIEARLAKEAEERAARELKETEKWAKQRRDEERKKLEVLRKKFRCHICGKRSSAPASYTNYSYEVGGDVTFTDWNKPADLDKCAKCGKWTCDSDLHRSLQSGNNWLYICRRHA